MSPNSIITILVIGLILTNVAWIVALVKLVRELTSKLMAGTLDNYAAKVEILAPKREVVRPSTKDKAELESGLAKAPDQYADLEDMPPEKSVEALRAYAELSDEDGE